MSNEPAPGTLHRLLDPATRIDLDDVGLPGHELGESIDRDGHREFWVINVAGLDTAGTDHGASRPPRHEQLRPLPAEVRAVFEHRCGRPRVDGQPCRQIVRRPGAACAWHQQQPAGQ